MKTLQVQKKSKNYRLEHFQESPELIIGSLVSDYLELHFKGNQEEGFEIVLNTPTNNKKLTVKESIEEIDSIARNVENTKKDYNQVDRYLSKFQKAIRIQMKHDEEPATRQENKGQEHKKQEE